MLEVKQNTYKGTRILLGDKKRDRINKCIKYLKDEYFTEISIPIIQYSSLYENKVGEENNNLMFNFKDRGNRELCLAPEYTAIIQNLSNNYFKYDKDIKLFYVQECFRGEKPQAGRYRQFTQLGVEILNPTKEYNLESIALDLCKIFSSEKEFILSKEVKRGLDYYLEGKGFEISCDKLGSSKQVCGGGSYEGGVGFAIGVDRLMLL